MPSREITKLEETESHAEEIAATPSCIQAIPGNIEGKDYILNGTQGDFHSFEHALQGLQDQDRFFVPGNFIGSNPKSLVMIENYMSRNQDKHRLFVARGQNEQTVLNYLIALENYENEISEKNQLALEKAQIDCESLNLNWIMRLDHEKQTQIKDFLTELPHIIHVEETKATQPFFVVHKDLPFKKQTRLRANLNQELTQKQLDHCITGDNPAYQEKFPVLSDHIVYCSNHPSPGVQLPGYRINVNIQTTHPDIDGAVLRVNHTDEVVDIVAAEKIKYSALKINILDLQAQIEMLLECSKQLQLVASTIESMNRVKKDFKQSSHAYFDKNAQRYSVPEEVAKSDPEFNLYCEKLNALFSLRENFKDQINTHNATPEDLLILVNNIFIRHAKTLLENFNEPNQELNEHFNNIFQFLLKHQYTAGRKTYNLFSQLKHYLQEEDGNLSGNLISTLEGVTAFNIVTDIMRNISSGPVNLKQYTRLLTKNFISGLCKGYGVEKLKIFLEQHFDLTPNTLTHSSLQERYYLPNVTPPVCIVEQKDSFYELAELDEKQRFTWIKNILVANRNTPNNPAITKLVRHYFNDPRELDKFIGFARDEIKEKEILEHLYGIPLFEQNPQKFRYFEAILFSNTDETIKKKALEENIVTQAEFNKFMVHCLSNQAIDLVTLQKKFNWLYKWHYEEIYAHPFRDKFDALAEPRTLAEILLRLPKQNLTIPLLSIYNDAALFPFDRKNIENYKIILKRCIEHYKDSTADFKKIESVFNKLLKISTDRLDELQNIYVKFISILNSTYSAKQKSDDLKNLLLSSYHSVIHSTFGAGSRLGKMLKGVLKDEFDVVFQTRSMGFFSRRIEIPVQVENDLTQDTNKQLMM